MPVVCQVGVKGVSATVILPPVPPQMASTGVVPPRSLSDWGWSPPSEHGDGVFRGWSTPLRGLNGAVRRRVKVSAADIDPRRAGLGCCPPFMTPADSPMPPISAPGVLSCSHTPPLCPLGCQLQLPRGASRGATGQDTAQKGEVELRRKLPGGDWHGGEHKRGFHHLTPTIWGQEQGRFDLTRGA